MAFTSTAQDTVEAKQTSYLMDTGNVYTYQYGDGSKYYLEFWKKDNAGYFNWRNKDFGTGFKETKAGLYHEGVKRLAYPIEKGKKWSDPLNDTIYIIKSINRLIKTPAGTFEKVVEVRATTKGVGGYSTSYYAPSKGEILSTINNQYTDFETEVHFKLIKITRDAQASSVQKLVDKQLETVKKQKISGYQFYEAYPVKFTGKDIPEVVVSSYRFEKKGFIHKSILQVYQYNKTQKKWNVIKKFTNSNGEADDPYGPLRYITKGKLIDNKKEQLVVGYVWGSDVALTPIVYGSMDGKTIKSLITTGDKAFIGGDAVIKNKELFFIEHLSTVSQRYVYKNGKFIHYQGTGADDRKLAGNAKHILMLEKRNGKPFLIGNRNIKMKVGESFAIVRKDKTDTSDNYIFRLHDYILPGEPLEVTGGALRAIKPGKFEMSILLDDTVGYRADIQITVVK